MKEITEERIEKFRRKLREENGIEISYERAKNLTESFHEYMKILPRRLMWKKIFFYLKKVLLVFIIILVFILLYSFFWGR